MFWRVNVLYLFEMTNEYYQRRAARAFFREHLGHVHDLKVKICLILLFENIALHVLTVFYYIFPTKKKIDEEMSLSLDLNVIFKKKKIFFFYSLTYFFIVQSFRFKANDAPVTM